MPTEWEALERCRLLDSNPTHPLRSLLERLLPLEEAPVIFDHPRIRILVQLFLIEDRRGVSAHGCRESLGRSVEIKRSARAVEEEASSVSARTHDRLRGRDDLGRRLHAVSRLAERRQGREGLPDSQRIALRPRDRAERAPSPYPDQEHPLPSLRHAIVGGVQDHQRDLILQFPRPPFELLAHRGPTRVEGQRLHVLHAEGSGGKLLDDVEEAVDVLGARVVGVHPAYHGEPLTGWTPDYDVGA